MKKNDFTIFLAIFCACVLAVTTLITGATENTVTSETQKLAESDRASNPNVYPSPGGSSAAQSGALATPTPDIVPSTPQEVVDKYTVLADKFKTERPAYKRKEYQALPEENRNFSSVINFILNIAAGYMVSEEDAEEISRAAGAEEILYDMPIHGAEKGCTLTNYDAVEWAKGEDLGDGTYKLSFSLKEEINAEPTPADTLIAPSAHGGVMQPMAYSDIKAEVDKVAGTIPGIAVNKFNLIYRECEFSCIYDPTTDEVKSITHHIVIDIEADAGLFGSSIVGSARLVNDMFIYDITW